MKIAHILKNFSLGGGPRAVYYFCKAMPQEEMYVFGQKGVMVEDFYKLSNVKVMFVDNWSIKNIYMIYRFIKSHQIDVIHFHNLLPTVYFLLFPMKQKVLTFHGLHIRKYDFMHQPLRRFLRKVIKNSLVIGSDKVIVLSDEDKIYLTRELYRKKDVEKIFVVPNAIEKPKITTDLTHMFSSKELNIIVVARYNFQKGYDILFSFLQEKKFIEMPVHFYIIGNRELQMVVAGVKLATGVKLTYISDTNVPYNYIQQADFLLLPSRWEGLPMVVLEALTLGTKVIAANTANINYLVDNKNVFIYKQSDKNSFWQTIKMAMATKDNDVDINLDAFSLHSVGRQMKLVYEK